MKIEIPYNLGRSAYFGINSPPKHRTLAHFWGGPDGAEFPYVVNVPEEEGQRLLKAFEEHEWAQRRLGELAAGTPPNKCQCGNCPK